MRKLNRVERAASIARTLGAKVSAKYCAKHGLSIHAALWIILRHSTLRRAPSIRTWINRRDDRPNVEQVAPVHERSEPAHCETDSDSCRTTPAQYFRSLSVVRQAEPARKVPPAKPPFIAVPSHIEV